MILNHSKNIAQIPEQFRLAFELLAKHDFANMACGRYQLDGENIFMLVMEPETKPAAEQRFEAHARYIDIQMLVSGAERIDYLPVQFRGRVGEDRMAQDDVAFYDEMGGSSSLILQPGMYAIFFPGELHRPCCASGAAAKIRKVVIKVEAERSR